MDPILKTRISRLKQDTADAFEDHLAVEKRLRILINGKSAMNLFCSPVMVRELVVGIVHNESLIDGEWCAERISIIYGDEIVADIPAAGEVNYGEPTITSGCVGGVSMRTEGPAERISDGPDFSCSSIHAVYREFQQRSELFRLTGAVHSAALAVGGKIVAFAEDIGRHNAVDKVSGYCLLESIPFEGSMMVVSGRLSSDIAKKCLRCRIPLVVSRSAPTSLAVEIAAASNMTMAGFLRGDRMNVYTNPGRIILS